MRVVEHHSRLFREAAQSLTLEMPKTRVDIAMSDLLEVGPALSKECHEGSGRGWSSWPFQPKLLCNSTLATDKISSEKLTYSVLAKIQKIGKRSALLDLNNDFTCQNWEVVLPQMKNRDYALAMFSISRCI